MQDIQHIIAKMTLEEKTSLCSGKDMWRLKSIERLGVSSIMVADGPHGLRKQPEDAGIAGLNTSLPATCFPTASALAATWNRDLIYQVGQALGDACLYEKVSMLLGPGVNIKRSPLCGRNFEYYSEDPFLAGELASSFILGVQNQGVGASLKHFAANNQEYRRMTSDSIVDERALREIYLLPFEIAVKKAQPWTVMCSYNRINGTYASEHRQLMTDILRDEWGYKGLVLTDWGAMNDPVLALKAGVDLEMPGAPNGNQAQIVAAVQAGELDQANLDRSVERILELVQKAQAAQPSNAPLDLDAQHALARRVAGEGVVLLKNENDLLPLPENARIALVGRFAKHPRYQGAGSSLVNPTRLENLHDELIKMVGEANLQYAPGYDEKGGSNEDLLQKAVEVAQKADVVVVCAGLTEMDEIEGIDRRHMRLPPGHNMLIERLSAAHQKVVVVLSNDSPVEMPWVQAVPAILEAYLGGQAGGGAVADILLGKVNPSGKLAETFPLTLEDTPAQPYPGGPVTVPYYESLYVGYRYYDSAQIEVLFPFGHGLSFTSFAYRDLEVAQEGETVSVSFKIQNTGERIGKEIAQLYVGDVHASNFRPDKELKGFTKVELEPGQERHVPIQLDRRAFAFYDAHSHTWVVEEGEFEILVGASSRDIRLSAVIHINGDKGKARPEDKTRLAEYFHPTKERGFRRGFRQLEFEALLGKPLPPNEITGKGNFTLNTPLEDMTVTIAGRLFHRLISYFSAKMTDIADDTPTGAMVRASLRENPLRSLLMPGSPLTRPQIEAILMIINGQFLKGIQTLIKTRRNHGRLA